MAGGYVGDWYNTALAVTVLPMILFGWRGGVIALASVAAHAAVGLYGLVAWLVVRSGGTGEHGRP